MINESEALQSLSGRVEKAASELERLHLENAQLADSLKVLWAKSSEPQSGASIVFDGDREQLREKVKTYIEVIDRHLSTL